MSKVSGLYIYPLKSAKGVHIDSSFVEFLGLKNDRRFMVIHKDGAMITSRKYSELLQVKVLINNQKITLKHMKFGKIKVNFDSFSLKEKKTKVWDDKFVAYETNKALDEFISKVIEIPAKLIYISDDPKRIGKHTKSKLSFADGYPLLLISEASLRELNRRSSIINKMEQFRPNIIVSNDIPFEEDYWKIIK